MTPPKKSKPNSSTPKKSKQVRGFHSAEFPTQNALKEPKEAAEDGVADLSASPETATKKAEQPKPKRTQSAQALHASEIRAKVKARCLASR